MCDPSLKYSVSLGMVQQADGTFEGYTDSEGNEFTGDRGSFTITDKFIGIFAH